jgi:hypothetical protein
MDNENGLTIADHTLLMEALADRIFLVARNVDAPEETEITPIHAIDAALKVRSFDAAMQRRLQRVRELLPVIEEGMEQLPAGFVESMTSLQDELSGPPVERKLALLEQRRKDADDGGVLATALDSASEVLRDGADRLYAPDSALEELMSVTTSTESSLGDIAAIDAIGGAIGGGVGLLAAGVGAPVGAAAGAAGASAGAITAAVIVHILR